MKSLRIDIPETPTYDDGPTVVDTATRELMYDLDDLTGPFKKLTQLAQQCWDERLESDVQNIMRYKSQKKESARTESRLEYIYEHAADLKQRLDAISQIPPHLLTHDPLPAESAEAELDAVLLGIEEQKLHGVRLMIEYTHHLIMETVVDLNSIGDRKTRTELKTALAKFWDAVSEFDASFSRHSEGRLRDLNAGLLNMVGPYRPRHGKSPALPQASELLDNETHDESNRTTSSPSVSDLSLGPPAIPVEEQLGPVRLSENATSDDMFRFERSFPPTLSRLAKWLGLDDDVSVALLLNTWPIEHAFQSHRAAPGQSCADDPERLKLALPLFAYPRETLELWQLKEDGLDIPAALFAYHVLRFLELSSEDVAWERLSGGLANPENYEIARRRWAIVLQIFWFMERSFENC